jgi:hypothetical protein
MMTNTFETGKRPDEVEAVSNIKVSGWRSGDDKGWSFMASRSYRDQTGNTVYTEMMLFERDLLILARCLERMSDRIAELRRQRVLDETLRDEFQ